MTTIRLVSLVAVVAMSVACGGSSGTSDGENASRDDVELKGDTAACDSLPMPAISCESGKTVAACDTSSGKAQWKITCEAESTTLPGAWGGEGIRLDIDEKLNGTLEFDCGGGAFSGIALDAKGEFNVVGTFTRGVPLVGPGQEEPKPVPAKYWGSAKGGTMTLYVQPDDSPDSSVFTLTLGSDPVLRKCQ